MAYIPPSVKIPKMSRIKEELEAIPEVKRHKDSFDGNECISFKNKSGEDLGSYCQDAQGNIYLARTKEKLCVDKDKDNYADKCILHLEKGLKYTEY